MVWPMPLGRENAGSIPGRCILIYIQKLSELRRPKCDDVIGKASFPTQADPVLVC